MYASDIIAKINKKVEAVSIGDKHPPLSEKYRHWHIGVTDDVNEWKRACSKAGWDIDHWNTWPADNETIARQVESHFLNRGMESGRGRGRKPNLVYIF